MEHALYLYDKESRYSSSALAALSRGYCVHSLCHRTAEDTNNSWNDEDNKDVQPNIRFLCALCIHCRRIQLIVFVRESVCVCMHAGGDVRVLVEEECAQARKKQTQRLQVHVSSRAGVIPRERRGRRQNRQRTRGEIIQE